MSRGIAGQWESFIIQVVPEPLLGVASGLVIAGSDKRGTIYGIYDLSEEIGVSPWYWWADVTPRHRDALFVKPAPDVQGPPAVKYRGIFLNDEAPDLTNWVYSKFGTAPASTNPPVPAGIANYGHAVLHEPVRGAASAERQLPLARDVEQCVQRGRPGQCRGWRTNTGSSWARRIRSR